MHGECKGDRLSRSHLTLHRCILLAVVATLGAVVPLVDGVRAAPVDTSAPGAPDTTVEVTVEITVDTSVSTSVANTSVGPVDAGPDDTGVDDDNTSVSAWWWVVGVLVAAAAVFGIAFSLRRRGDVERWARNAAVACDIGRAMTLTLTTQLANTSTWTTPARYVEQELRFRQALDELAGSVPDRDFPLLLAMVAAAHGRLRSTVDMLDVDRPITMARNDLQPAIDELATALSALESEASITVYGAAFPSGRPTR